MELQGEQWVQASREAVWRALNDPLVLAKCVPGCEEMRRVSETEIEARLLAKIGPVRAHFSGRIQMHDVVAPERCRIAFEGSGGAAGMAKGESKVTLTEDNGGTRLSYTAEAAVGGKLGQIGGRLINASARKMADEFFQALNAQLAPSAPPAPAASATPANDAVATAAPARAAAPAVAPSPAGGPVWANEFQRILWLAIGIGVGWLACRAFSF
ncbi:CoxG family protein [Variovorax sp. IB41]|uniref:CoxG family protein n=1 Tax=Variovorax sp. IB41 TaxID=2779370 RepID=UPI0018E75AA6|nr:carbon monoxide dehydrogenase subunit G [Variovorax sp. IB41]MBJ2154947.1 carbon monoxide dehydrogenase subunit G [Variovorax sp. IB41]